jgi:predicted esterase
VDYDQKSPAEEAPPAAMSVSEAMAEICATSEEYQAEYADAAAAVVAYLRERRAELAGLPVIVTGYSLGAIMTPTTVARIGEDVRGVVMFVGGANMPGITVDSSVVRDKHGPIAVVRRAPAEERERLIGEALRAVPLDGYHTAPLLASRPVLVIHASEDGMVPSKYGDLLWERAGRPERWTRETGHMLMFLMLADQARDIADWIDKEVPGAGVRVGGGVER